MNSNGIAAIVTAIAAADATYFWASMFMWFVAGACVIAAAFQEAEERSR